MPLTNQQYIEQSSSVPASVMQGGVIEGTHNIGTLEHPENSHSKLTDSHITSTGPDSGLPAQRQVFTCPSCNCSLQVTSIQSCPPAPDIRSTSILPVDNTRRGGSVQPHTVRSVVDSAIDTTPMHVRNPRNRRRRGRSLHSRQYVRENDHDAHASHSIQGTSSRVTNPFADVDRSPRERHPLSELDTISAPRPTMVEANGNPSRSYEETLALAKKGGSKRLANVYEESSRHMGMSETQYQDGHHDSVSHQKAKYPTMRLRDIQRREKQLYERQLKEESRREEHRREVLRREEVYREEQRREGRRLAGKRQEEIILEEQRRDKQRREEKDREEMRREEQRREDKRRDELRREERRRDELLQEELRRDELRRAELQRTNRSNLHSYHGGECNLHQRSAGPGVGPRYSNGGSAVFNASVFPNDRVPDVRSREQMYDVNPLPCGDFRQPVDNAFHRGGSSPRQINTHINPWADYTRP